MIQIDVVINVYGKPWQTLCTLKSLLKHSEKHIDKIFLIKEPEQPYNENIDWIFDYFDNLEVYTVNSYQFIRRSTNLNDSESRFGIRYQYGIENSDKKFVFITHNDVLYSGDVVGNMIKKIGDSVGIGQIGQCWNCPLFYEEICSGDRFNEINGTDFSNLDILEIVDKYPRLRTHYQSRHDVNIESPIPMPECRLNEWACMINREIVMKECLPNGDSSMFGLYGLDLGGPWFHEMYKKGYKFVDFRDDYFHSFWSTLGAGFPTQLNEEYYKLSEDNAKKYFEDNFKKK